MRIGNEAARSRRLHFARRKVQDPDPPQGLRSPICCIVVLVLGGPAAADERAFPDWTRSARIADFVLEFSTAAEEMEEFASDSAELGANVVLVHFEEENLYGSLVDEVGWRKMLARMARFLEIAHAKGLRVVWYVNGLEVMTRDAADDPERPSLARDHPDWLQRRVSRGAPGEPVVFTGLDYEWVTPDMEDAWICPLSGYGDLVRSRIDELAKAGLDAVWIDACFLPGVQPEEKPIWACGCERCRDRFAADTGLSADTGADPGSANFSDWLAWRERLVASYLAGLAEHAWSRGVVPFYESSALDSPSATLLASDAAAISKAPIGYAPEIDGPRGRESFDRANEDEWLAYLSMLLYARDVSGEKPCWVLQYAAGPEDAARQFGMTLAATGCYFPVFDSEGKNELAFVRRAFTFARERADVLGAARPYAPVLVLYSSRGREQHDGVEADSFSTAGTRFFASYRAAVRDLVAAHVPFGIAFSLAGRDLSDVRAVIVPEGVPAEEIGALPPGCARIDAGADGLARLPDVSLPFTIEAPVSTAVLVSRTPNGWLVTTHPLGNPSAVTIALPEGASAVARRLDGDQAVQGRTVRLPAREWFHWVEIEE